MEFLSYIIAGVASGILSGMFGVGGGIIIVPILSFIFIGLHFPPSHMMHLAIGTSLATIIINSIASAWGHHQRQNIDWKFVKNTALPCIFGVILGAFIAASIHSNQLKILFALFELIVAIKLLVESHQAELSATSLKLNKFYTGLIGSVVGLISSLIGIGGGTVSVPILMYLHMPTRRAIGTSAAIGFPVSVTGTIAYAIAGWHVPNLPSNSLGFIYLPAFAGIAIGSVFTTRLGVSLAHKLPIPLLKRLLAVLLLFLSIKMGWGVIR